MLVPPDDRVLCRLLPAESVTSFGLEIPETAQEKPLRAVVLAVGAGRRYDGVQYPFEYVIHHTTRSTTYGVLAPGDEVILPKYGGTEIEAEDGETVISILGSEILARVAGA